MMRLKNGKDLVHLLAHGAPVACGPASFPCSPDSRSHLPPKETFSGKLGVDFPLSMLIGCLFASPRASHSFPKLQSTSQVARLSTYM